MELPDETTNPTDDAASVATEAEVANDETQDETTAEGEEAEATPEDDSEEVEVDGQKFKLPKAVVPKLMMQADYTKKTQEVAEQRRAIETERQQFEMTRQQHTEFMDDIAELKTVDRQIAELSQIDFEAFARQNPNEAQAYWMRYQQMQQHRAARVAQIESKSQSLREARERDIANVRQKAVEALSKPDPNTGWDGKFDSDKSNKLTEFGKKLGFSPDELQSIASPVAIKTLNLAMIGAQYLEQQRKAVKPAVPKAEPVPEVNTSRAKPVQQGLHDNLSVDEWLKRRNAQLKARR
jgi:hypothetical protein